MASPVPEERKASYNFLGNTGLKVSNLCLGTLTFGENQAGYPGQSDENLSHQIINRYVEWGGNFLDTANMYGYGKSEEIIGRWLERQNRDKFIIATKVGVNAGKERNVNYTGLSRRHITESIDKSLKRLRTDYVDLYQMHLWDDGTPLDETLRTMDDLVRCGKIRYVGASNTLGWQMQKLVGTTEKLGINPVVSLQQQYSLLVRNSELDPFQVCKTSGIGVLPWSPLRGGLLSGKYKRNDRPKEGRIGYVAQDESKEKPAAPAWSRIDSKAFDIIEAAEAIAVKAGRSLPQVALRWLLQKDVVTSVIIGARTMAQLDDNMGAANGWSLSTEEMKELDDISQPTIPYPYAMINNMNSNRANPRIPDPYVRSLCA